MAYSRSIPYKGFCLEVNEIIKILKRSKLKKNSNLDIRFKEYIVASSIFLAHAELENYIKDVFDLYIRNLAQKKFLELNEDLRAYLILKFFSKKNMHISILMKEEGLILKEIKKESSNSSKHIFDKDLCLTYIKGADVYETYKYPSVKNLQKIYKRIGCDNIFNLASAIIKKNSQKILELIGTYRTSLAHNATLTGITIDDLINSLEDLKIFAKGLDNVLYNQIVKDHTQIFWRDYIQ